MNDEIRQNIIQEYQEGIPMKDISNKYGYSIPTIYYVLKRANISRTRPKGLQSKKEQAQKAIEEWLQDRRYTIEDICKKYNISHVTFRLWRKKLYG